METGNQGQTSPMPRIGDKAPAFKAITTQGDINFPELSKTRNANLNHKHLVPLAF